MNDPIGQAIFEYHFFGKSEMLVVDTNYTEDEELDPAWFFRSGDQMPVVETRALELSRGKVLDIGAGAGSHALELQNKGLRVTALDRSEKAVTVMIDRGLKKVVCEDIFNYHSGSFDTILLLMNGAGIGGTLPGLSKLLDHLQQLLASGGQILMDSSDISYLFTEEDGSVWTDLTRQNYYGEMIYEVSHRSLRSDKFFWLFVDFETLSGVAANHGFHSLLEAEGENGSFLAKLTRL